MNLKSQWQGLKWSLMSPKKKQKLLDDACELLRFWPETDGLLALAAENHIGIRFDEALENTNTDGYLHRNRTTGETFIALKPCLKPNDIAIPLIHELRHLWQERQLGLTPQTAGLAEPDAQTALIVTRAKEADAFAFTNLMIARINHAQDDFRAAKNLSGDAQEEYLSARMAARLASEKQKMEQDFLRELGDLASYDRAAVRDYHRRYISATGPALDHAPAKDGHVFGLGDLRRIFVTGTAEGMPPYLDALDDKTLLEKILAGAASAVREAVSLIDAFEKSAARGPLADQKRAEIERRMQFIQTI